MQFAGDTKFPRLIVHVPFVSYDQTFLSEPINDITFQLRKSKLNVDVQTRVKNKITKHH